MAQQGLNMAAEKAAGARGGPGNGTPAQVTAEDVKRCLNVAWIKVHEDSKTVTAIYVKNVICSGRV